MIRIGIDLGGTNIAVGAVDDGHAIVSRVSVPTLARRPAAEVVGNMGDAVEAALAQAGLSIGDCRSIGIGSPSTMGLQMAYWACAPLGVNSTYPVSMVTSPESPL